MEQFTPTVSEADVERVVRRDLPPETHEEIRAIIQQVEVIEKPRVILACLKCAGGNIEKLKGNLAEASGYYRELLGEAEYPNWIKKMFHIEKLSEAEQNKIIEKDKDQYLAWLYRE
ncbi:MAG TPA: hypothetical protein VJW75_01540 [Candidatus Eisenbacteria bacterium]|nr:hypothetical protein [Candidatus Eisenbacteria bacterium]